MNIQTLTVESFRRYVEGKFFTVEFIKDNGEERTLSGRLSVKKFVKGTQPEVTAKRNATLTERNKIGVWEVSNPTDENGHVKEGDEKYRVINLNSIKRLSANNEIFYAKENNGHEFFAPIAEG